MTHVNPVQDWQRKESVAAAMLNAADDDDEVDNAPSEVSQRGEQPPRRRKKKVAVGPIFDKPDLPAVRSAGVVKINFTATTRPTPARADNMDAVGPNDAQRSKPVLKRVHNPDAVDIGEQNPVWLKDRGDAYFAKGDFASAVNAYSSAISLDDDEYVATMAGRVATYYSNRAACYFQLAKHRKCASDCDRALELLDLAQKGSTEVPTPKTVRSMCKLFARRGASLAALTQVDEARADYRKAITMAPEDMGQELQMSLEKLSALEMKLEADATLKMGNFVKAIELYSDARAIDATNAALWSNAAICHLALKDHKSCVAACSEALTLLEAPELKGGNGATRAKAHLRRWASFTSTTSNPKPKLIPISNSIRFAS